MREENEAIIKALNMYGRVPEQWELLNEIERLKQDNEYLNKVNIELSSRNSKAREYIEERKNLNWYADGVFVYELLNILQGSDKE